MQVTASPTQKPEKVDRLVKNISRLLLGKEEVIRLALTAFFARGHLLLEDVPGVGKTLLAKAIARSIQGSFRRIQMTPDLLPSDITGINMFYPQTSQFQFTPGPIFCNILLADEINRATPRTQSALLEAMEEHQATVEGTTHPLLDPFFVIATQNPIEYQGTFPLPEAQLDRFMLSLTVGYPDLESELAMLDLDKESNHLEPVLTQEEVISLQQQVKEVKVSESLKRYVLALIRKTREDERILLGGSPRASLMLMKGAQVQAFFEGRSYALPDDVKKLFIPVMVHRLILKEGVSKKEQKVEQLQEILDSTAIL